MLLTVTNGKTSYIISTFIFLSEGAICNYAHKIIFLKNLKSIDQQIFIFIHFY